MHSVNNNVKPRLIFFSAQKLATFVSLCMLDLVTIHLSNSIFNCHWHSVCSAIAQSALLLLFLCGKKTYVINYKE